MHKEKHVALMDYFSHSAPREKTSRCYARDETRIHKNAASRGILYKSEISLGFSPRACPVDTLNANAG